ncbi:MAG: hypothetical protein HYZ28_05200 [Myxococcales bacterium]|nr:hypothetical protein [Myxococcales bacterium]
MCDVAEEPEVAPDAGQGRPSYCVRAVPDTVQDIEGTPAGPYLVHHPKPDLPMAPTVVFLPGGSGSWNSAQRVWERFVSGDARVEQYRVVIPYSYAEDFIDDARRTFVIADEVLLCYGGDSARVHLAGYSNGGRAAFGLMLASPERFVTLLGAPGVFPTSDRAVLAKALACRGRAVFNGVGELDEGWKQLVRDAHAALLEAGVDSIYVEFPGETHRLSDAFDEGLFFDFWGNH